MNLNFYITFIFITGILCGIGDHKNVLKALQNKLLESKDNISKLFRIKDDQSRKSAVIGMFQNLFYFYQVI